MREVCRFLDEIVNAPMTGMAGRDFRYTSDPRSGVAQESH